jgi:hypothetical protein
MRYRLSRDGARGARLLLGARTQSRGFCAAARLAAEPTPGAADNGPTTHFGFKTIPAGMKEEKGMADYNHGI